MKNTAKFTHRHSFAFVTQLTWPPPVHILPGVLFLFWINDCCSSSLTSMSLVSISLCSLNLCLFKATWQAWFESLGWEGMQEVWLWLFWQASTIRISVYIGKHIVFMSPWHSEACRLLGPFHLWLSLAILTSPLSKLTVHQRPLDGSCGKMCHSPKGSSY